ncbi:MAG: hypothetical protein JNL98_09585 [Bryobacterales bacterium]|nr:hypothetical protein [Bryobacterales bacterium]
MRVLICLLAAACASVPGQTNDAELARQVNNPVARMISVPIQSEWYFGVGPNRDTVYALQFKPVVPFTLNSKWNILTRYILPVAHVPDLFGGVDFLPANQPTIAATGNGDLTVTAWLTPSNMPRAGRAQILYGIGTALMAPTASSSSLGTGKWNGGPSMLAGYMRGRMIAGALVQNIWSFAGASDRAPVNQFMVQPFWSYRLNRGWSVVVSPPITSNWRASSDRWTVPLGAGFAKLVRFGQMPVTLGAEAMHYSIRPAGNGPRWTFRLNAKFIVPR